MAFSFSNFLKGFANGALGATGLGSIIPAVGSIAGAAVSSNAASKAAAAQKEAADRAAAAVTQAGKDAASGVHSATEDANGILSNIYTDVKGGIQPYRDAGSSAISTLSALTQPGGELAQKFTADNFKDLDPGFDFRLSEGVKALDRSAAARGGALSGGSLRSITRYGQDYGSSEFGKAFDRFETQKNDRYNMLSGIAGFGQNANGQLISAGSQFGAPQATNLINDGVYGGNAGMLSAREAGEFGTQAANATASGYTGTAKAINGGISGVTNAAQNLYLSSILNKKPKAAAPAYSGPSYYDE